MNNQKHGRSLVEGRARGKVLHTDVPLSFWMGIDPQTGVVIDKHHPLSGVSVTGKILLLPGGRGSCSGSCGLVELIMSGYAPAALVLEAEDPILALGALLAAEIFGRSIPVVSVDPQLSRRLASMPSLAIEDSYIAYGEDEAERIELKPVSSGMPALQLSPRDMSMIAGDEGPGRQSAMRIIQRFAEVVGARSLIDIEQAHIDCCFYTGPAGLAFAERLASMGARVSVPTTTNATSADGRRWRATGVDPALGEMSDRVAAAYVNMGAKGSFTCAPYLLDGAPEQGRQIAWGESNAVAYANSVLGARTMKYPDLLEVCVALTGRAPLTASHMDEGRRASLHIDIGDIQGFDDAFYPLLGYHVGAIAGYEIPAITGLQQAKPTADDLKAFSAAFATTSGSPMFHIVGITPEAPTLESALDGNRVSRTIRIERRDLQGSWAELNSATESSVGLVSLGNPHFSLTEIQRTAALCQGQTKAAGVRLRIACGRDIHARAAAAGLIAELERFGAEFLNDTCWCMVDAKQLSDVRGAVMTNSAKFAHYGPGITDRRFHFAGLAACVAAACSAEHRATMPSWLCD